MWAESAGLRDAQEDETNRHSERVMSLTVFKVQLFIFVLFLTPGPPFFKCGLIIQANMLLPG